MSANLLQKIQQDSTDDSVRVATLLRSCKILAAHLSYQPLQDWVDHELEGYPSNHEVPPYRIIHGLELRGLFVGPFGSQIKNGLIPRDIFPDSELQGLVSSTTLRDSVPFYESLYREAEATHTSLLKQPIHEDVVRLASGRVYENYSCLEAWLSLPTSSVSALVERVRNAVLTFSLEVERLDPDAGEKPAGSHPIADEELSAMYNRILSKRL